MDIINIIKIAIAIIALLGAIKLYRDLTRYSDDLDDHIKNSRND